MSFFGGSFYMLLHKNFVKVDEMLRGF